MSALDATSGPSLTARQYRWLDRVTKLLGLAFVAAGLEVGGATLAGIALAAIGVASALITVFIDRP